MAAMVMDDNEMMYTPHTIHRGTVGVETKSSNGREEKHSPDDNERTTINDALDAIEPPRYASLDDDDDPEHDDDLPVSLADSLLNMFTKPKHADVTFIVGSEQKEFQAHRMFLATRSIVFELMLYPQFAGQEKELKYNDRMEIRVPDVRPSAFVAMLRCIYTGRADGITAETYNDMLYVAQKYGVDSLRIACADFIASGMTVNNVCLLYENPLLDDKERLPFHKYIEEHAYKVLQTSSWMELQEKSVIDICKSNSLVIAEEELFDAILEWGAAQCQRKQIFPDHVSLKHILVNILPHIRFPSMSMAEIANKVKPSGLLSDQDLLHIYMFLCAKGATVCRAPYSSEPRTGRASFFKWEASKKSAMLQLFDEGRGAVSTSSSWQTVVSDSEWRDGIYEWELVLHEYSTRNTFNVITGVVPADYSSSNWSAGASQLIGHSNNLGWGLITGNGQIATGSRGYSAVSYTTKFSLGDRVGHRLDLKRGTLEYFKNGRSCGIAFTDIRAPVRAAINVIDAQRVQLNFKHKPLR